MTFSQVVHAVLAESAVSYTVGFAADAAGSALEFRDLRIETAQPGLQLVYPRGYLAGPVPQPAAGREREIASVLTSPVESREISLRMELQETTAEGKPALNLRGRILGSDITQQPDGAGFIIAVDISCHQMSAEGRDLGGLDFPVAATLDAAHAQQFRQGGGTWNRMVRPSSRSHPTPHRGLRPELGQGRFHIRAPATPHRYRQADGHFPDGREPGAGSFSGGAEEGRVRDRLAPRGDCGQRGRGAAEDRGLRRRPVLPAHGAGGNLPAVRLQWQHGDGRADQSPRVRAEPARRVRKRKDRHLRIQRRP